MELEALEEKIIYYLMMQSGSISVARLADLCNVSANSIRSRIPFLNEKIEPEDLHIVMKRSVGCELHKLSEEKNEAEEISDLRFRLNRTNYTNRNDRTDFIIRRLLCTTGYLPLQSACDMLYCSYSELHRDIASANLNLKKFHLKIATRRSKGLFIEGDEFHKRICMTFQHKRFRYLSEDQKKNEPWFAAVFANSLSHETIQKCITETLADYPAFAYSHINFPKINNIFYIMKARHRYSGDIRFPDEMKAHIRSIDAYRMAKDLLAKISSRISFDPYEEDVLCLAVILESYRSIRSVEDIRSIRGYRRFREEARIVLDEMAAQYFGPSLCAGEDSLDSFVCILYTAWTLVFYDLPLDEEMLFPLRANDAASADLALSVHHILKERYNITLDKPLLRFLTYSLRPMQKDFSRTVDDCSLLIYSIYGAEYARYIAANLSKIYGNDISCIDYAESMPDMHTGLNKQYDLFLTDNSKTNLRKMDPSVRNIPVIWLPLSNFPRHYRELDEWLKGRQNRTLHEISDGRIQHGACRTADEIYAQLYESVRDVIPVSLHEFISSCEQREAVISSARDNRIAYIAMDECAVKTDVIAVLINKKPVPWYDGTKAQFFVFYQYSGKDYRKTRAAMEFLRMFVRQTPAALLSMVERGNDEIISLIMDAESFTS